MLSMTILKYGIIDLIPNAGFGLWFKTVIHLVAALIHVGLVSVLVGFAVRAGVFSNIHLMVALGLISAFAVVATLLRRRRCIVLWLINLKTKPPNSPSNDRRLGRTRCGNTWSGCRPATATSGG